MSRAKPFAITLAVAALLVAGCGEKEEPSAGELGDEAAQAEEERAPDFPIAGSWEGELRQKGVKPFQVTAEITGPEGPNTVHYTGIDCSGKWTYEGKAAGRFTFHERIDRGQRGDCKGSGTVSLSPEGGGELGYVFQGGGVESRGTLERAD